MATRTFQTDIITEIFSVDGDKSISISQLGLTLKRDILTTPIETIITPLDITDVNTGNVITMDRLTYLPTGLAALTVPSDGTTCNFNDAIQLQDYNATLAPPATHSEVKIGSNPASLFGIQVNSNDPAPPTFTMSSDTPLILSTTGYDLTLNAGGGGRLLLNSEIAESYWGDFSVGSNANIALNLGGNCSCDIDTRDGVCNIGDIAGVGNSTAINLDDTSQSITITALLTTTFNSGDFTVNAVNDINMLAPNTIDIISSTADINLTANLGNVYINNTISNAGDGNLVVTDITAPIDLTMNSVTGNVNINATGSIIANSSNIELVSGIGAVIIGDVNNSFFGTKISLNDATQTVSYTGIQTWNGTVGNTLNWNGTDTLTITDGTTSNSINKSGYTTRNTVANVTHFLNFSDSSATGTGAIQKTAGIECNPSTKTITATTFAGTATNTTNVGVTSDNTAGTYYIPFAKTSGTGNKPLFIDDTTGPLSYNPSTATVSASAYTITTTPSTATVASQFGQVGLVKLQIINTAIVGSALPLTFNLANIFTSAYKNYRIILQPRNGVTFTAYPAYNLSAFLGTGTLPTTANLYGYEMTSSNTVLVAPLFTTGIVIASTPVIVAVTGLTNKVVSFDITNVGYLTTSATVVNINCKSFYNNPGINGVSDRNIQIAATSGSTITGLTLQQTSIGVGNNMDLSAIIYGYNQL